MAGNRKSDSTFKLGKNKIMRVLVFREGGTQFAGATDEGAGYVIPLFGLAVNLLEGAYN